MKYFTEINLNQKQTKLELTLQRKQNMTFSTQLIYRINLFKFGIYFYKNNNFTK